MHAQNIPTGSDNKRAAIEVDGDAVEKICEGKIDTSKSNHSTPKTLHMCARVEGIFDNMPIAGTKGEPENRNPDQSKVNSNKNRCPEWDGEAGNVVENDNEKRRRRRPEKQKKGRPPKEPVQINDSKGRIHGAMRTYRDRPKVELIDIYSTDLENNDQDQQQ